MKFYYRQTCVLKMCPNMNKKVRSLNSSKTSTVELEETIRTAPISIDDDRSVEIGENNVEQESNRTLDETNMLLENHENENKNARLYYKCGKCGKSFAKKRYASSHCKPKKPWRCPICSENIYHKKNTKRHLDSCQKKFLGDPKVPNTSTTPTFPCDVCNKSFLFKRNMLRHKEKLHRVAEIKVLACERNNCSFTTNSKGQMKRHMTVRHGTGPTLDCDECDSKFLSQNGLRKHKLETHRLRCDKCTDSFANAKQLRVHKAIYHVETSQGQDASVNTETNTVYVTRAIGEHSSVHVYNNNPSSE